MMLLIVVVCFLMCNIRRVECYTSAIDDNFIRDERLKDRGSLMTCKQQNLLSEVSLVYKIQNEFEMGKGVMEDTLVVLFQDSTWNLAVEFEKRVVSFKPHTQLVYWYVKNTIALGEDLKISLRNWRELAHIHSLVLFLDSNELVASIIEYVSAKMIFKWTSLLHTTEWVIASSSCLCELMMRIRSQQSAIDFITLIFITNCHTAVVAQKSRTQRLEIVHQRTPNECKSSLKNSANISGQNSICDNFNLLNNITSNDFKDKYKYKFDNCYCQNNPLVFETALEHKVPSKNNDGTEIERSLPRNLKLNQTLKLRPNALLYLNSKKSVMDGLHIPAAILSVDAREAFRQQKSDGNDTEFDGVAIVLLKTIAMSLGFTYDLVWAQDSGFYGTVNKDGTATGVTGQLQRREAALTTLTLSWLNSRDQVIDFVSVPTIPDDPISIVYRLPSTDKNLDTTFIDIIEPDFLLLILGPLLGLIAIGTVAHLVTKSCTLIKPQKLSILDLRRLHSCPDHICFHTNKLYASQTGRILRASWGVFCIIVSAAYSAHLVTTFTLKPKELSIQTFEDLLKNPGFKFGMPEMHTALILEMKTSKDKTIRAVWRKIKEFNQTDPDTLSSNITLQVNRVLAGDYALIDSINIGRMSELVPADYSEIRCYSQTILDPLTYSYVGTPKHAFYEHAVYSNLLQLEGAGILQRLRIMYSSGKLHTGKDVSSHFDLINDELQDHRPVSFKKILFLVYVTVTGIGLSIFTLVMELFIKRCVRFSAVLRVS